MVRRTVRKRRGQRGFTLIEIMVVVALIGVLSTVVVPGFFRESRKSKASTEVSAMFAELARGQEGWRLDNGAYRTTAACPAAPSAQGQDVSACIATGTDWKLMRVNPPDKKLFCTYQMVAGSAVGTNNPSGFVFASPARGWYYMIATCDMDGVTSTYSTYFASSMDSKVQKQNEGK